MKSMTWCRAVVSVLPGPGVIFETSEVYQYKDLFATIYPQNRHIRDKIRQVLGELQTQGRLVHIANGVWKVCR